MTPARFLTVEEHKERNELRKLRLILTLVWAVIAAAFLIPLFIYLGGM